MGLQDSLQVWLIGLSCLLSRIAAKRLGNTSWQLEKLESFCYSHLFPQSSLPPSCLRRASLSNGNEGTGQGSLVKSPVEWDCGCARKARQDGQSFRPGLFRLFYLYIFIRLSSIRHSQPPQSLRRHCLLSVGSLSCPLGPTLSGSVWLLGIIRFPTSPTVRCMDAPPLAHTAKASFSCMGTQASGARSCLLSNGIVLRLAREH